MFNTHTNKNRVMKNTKKVDVTEVGFTSEIYKVSKVGNRFLLMNTEGQVAEAPVGSVMRRTAGLSNKAVRGVWPVPSSVPKKC